MSHMCPCCKEEKDFLWLLMPCLHNQCIECTLDGDKVRKERGWSQSKCPTCGNFYHEIYHDLRHVDMAMILAQYPDKDNEVTFYKLGGIDKEHDADAERLNQRNIKLLGECKSKDLTFPIPKYKFRQLLHQGLKHLRTVSKLENELIPIIKRSSNKGFFLLENIIRGKSNLSSTLRTIDDHIKFCGIMADIIDIVFEKNGGYNYLLPFLSEYNFLLYSPVITIPSDQQLKLVSSIDITLNTFLQPVKTPFKVTKFSFDDADVMCTKGCFLLVYSPMEHVIRFFVGPSCIEVNKIGLGGLPQPILFMSNSTGGTILFLTSDLVGTLDIFTLTMETNQRKSANIGLQHEITALVYNKSRNNSSPQFGLLVKRNKQIEFG